ncbi:MAG: TetR/AcrR family transcriptional regulator [Bacteroidota bacterium]
MARPREFDIDTALKAAMETFWLKGYTATSMADLMDAMGLQKGSIYKAFGNKHALFLSALRNYLQTAFFSLKSRMDQATTPLEAIEVFLGNAVQTCSMSPRKGCFALNTVVELGPHDDETLQCLNDHFANIRQLVTQTIQAGQAQQLMRSDTPAHELAEYLMTVQIGIVSSAKHAHSVEAKAKVAGFALAQVTA